METNTNENDRLCDEAEANSNRIVQMLQLSAKLNTLRDVVHGLAIEKGWHPEGESVSEYFPKAIANLHGEASELFEAYRAQNLFNPCDKAEKMNFPLTCAEEELADIVIRALDTAGRLKIDIGRAVRVKHAYNATRDHRHGGKLA